MNYFEVIGTNLGFEVGYTTFIFLLGTLFGLIIRSCLSDDNILKCIDYIKKNNDD